MLNQTKEECLHSDCLSMMKVFLLLIQEVVLTDVYII